MDCRIVSRQNLYVELLIWFFISPEGQQYRSEGKLTNTNSTFYRRRSGQTGKDACSLKWILSFGLVIRGIFCQRNAIHDCAFLSLGSYLHRVFHQQATTAGRMSSSASKSLSRAKLNLTMIIKKTSQSKIRWQTVLSLAVRLPSLLWFVSKAYAYQQVTRRTVHSILLDNWHSHFWRKQTNMANGNRPAEYQRLWICFIASFSTLLQTINILNYQMVEGHVFL